MRRRTSSVGGVYSTGLSLDDVRHGGASRNIPSETAGLGLYGEALMKPTIDRRQLVLAALATGCLASLTPEALAQVRSTARVTGLPLLTMASLARVIPAPGARSYNADMQAAAPAPR